MANPKDSKIKSDYINDFNTDSDEYDDVDLTPVDDSKDDFASMLQESFQNANKRLKVGDKIKGKILNLGSQDVFVTTGTQRDGTIQRSELIDADGNCPYKVGDTIELFVTLVKKDEIRLSKQSSDRNLAEDIRTAFENNQPITGRIVEECKGGVRVNIKGKLAFCPISQIDSQHIETAADYVGKSFDFKVTEFSEGGKNIVVSRRKLLDAEREVGTTSFLAEKKDGDIVSGRVTRFEPFGAFVELAPGVDGLVHISEIAWSRIASPAEVLQLGQTVNVKILKREVINGRAKISLSIKQVTPKEDKAAAPEMAKDDPWQKLSIGQTFTGKVTRKEHYGLFVQIEPGITGLMHKSRVESNTGFQFDKTRVNDSITVQIIEIKLGERQIALGLPGDPSEHEWKTSYKENANASLGTLGDRMGAMLNKKK